MVVSVGVADDLQHDSKLGEMKSTIVLPVKRVFEDGRQIQLSLVIPVTDEGKPGAVVSVDFAHARLERFIQVEDDSLNTAAPQPLENHGVGF
jgi:hypothetical protein